MTNVFTATHRIIESGRDYTGFRRYMVSDCNVVDDCTSPMCPKDIRLNDMERKDAEFCCKIQNRKPVVKNALSAFVQKYCSYWQKRRPDPNNDSKTLPEKLCRGGGSCLIMQGKPCHFFKTAVFPICDPAYKYATETGKYKKLLALYKEIDPDIVGTEAEVRRCECGTPLKPRQRFCAKCSQKRRRQTYRNSRQKRAG